MKFDSLRFFGVKLEKKCAALGQKRVGKTCEDKEVRRPLRPRWLPSDASGLPALHATLSAPAIAGQKIRASD